MPSSPRKIALVTGASRGIGLAIAKQLAQDGFDIWLNYHSNHAAAQAAQKEIESFGARCTLLPFDVADGAAVQAALNPLLKEHTPYALVNNAGIRKDNLLLFMQDQEWNAVLSTVLGGFYQVTKTVLAHCQYCFCGGARAGAGADKLFGRQGRSGGGHAQPGGGSGQTQCAGQCRIARVY